MVFTKLFFLSVPENGIPDETNETVTIVMVDSQENVLVNQDFNFDDLPLPTQNDHDMIMDPEDVILEDNDNDFGVELILQEEGVSSYHSDSDNENNTIQNTTSGMSSK